MRLGSSITDLLLRPARTKVGKVEQPTRMRIRGTLDSSSKVQAPFSGIEAAAFLVEVGARYLKVVQMGNHRHEREVFEVLDSMVVAGSLRVRTEDGVVSVSPAGLRITIPSASELNVTPIQGKIPAELQDAARRLEIGSLCCRELSLSNDDEVELRATIDSGEAFGTWDATEAQLIDLSVPPRGMPKPLLIRIALVVALFAAITLAAALM